MTETILMNLIKKQIFMSLVIYKYKENNNFNISSQLTLLKNVFHFDHFSRVKRELVK